MYSIIIPTYRVPEYLKLCIDSILENSYYKTHQLCIHVNGHDRETTDYLDDKNIKYIITEEVGVPEALNICIDQVKCNNILITNDDCYFTKNWDYCLHKWEIELNEKFPDYLKFIGYRWCEPTPGSFPPICNAGTNIKEFNIGVLNKYVSENSIHDIGEWYFNSLYPTEIIKKCRYSPEFFPRGCVDIDHGMILSKYLKDNNIKFLLFSVKDCFVYHFQRVASLKNRPNGEEDSATLFEKKWNIGVGKAHELLRDESKRSISIIKG